MGAAASSNAVSAVTNVTNSVSQSTTADSDQVNSVTQDIIIDQCDISAKNNIDFGQVAKTSVKNSQILKAIQNSSIQNKIAQKLAQEATSKIGSLGIGYASASNDVNTMANATTTISDAMSATCNQLNYQNNSFTCYKSSLSANNIFINQNASSEFLSNQVLDNDQVTTLINDVSQDVSQKASATVEGILGMIFLIIIAISLLGFSFASSKSVVLIVLFSLIMLTILIFVFMYIKETPPFFSKPNECVYGSTIGGCNKPCVDMKKNTMYIKKSPLRYNFSIIKSSSGVINMLDMTISALSQSHPINGGYNKASYLEFEDKGRWNFDSYYTEYNDPDVPQLPNPLTLPEENCFLIPKEYRVGDNSSSCTPSIINSCVDEGSVNTNCPTDNVSCETCQSDDDDPGVILAIPNMTAWTSYLNTGDRNIDRKRQLHARFVFSMYLGFPCNIYIDDDELVSYVNEKNEIVVDKAKNHKDKCLKFNIQNVPTGSNFINGITSGGSLVGNVGYCNTNAYKFQKFMRKAGIWLILFIMFIIILYTIIRSLRKS
jgi:hypothetical protein